MGRGDLKVERICGLLNPEIKKKVNGLLVRKYSTLCSNYFFVCEGAVIHVRSENCGSRLEVLLRLNLILMSICKIILHIFEYQAM